MGRVKLVGLDFMMPVVMHINCKLVGRVKLVGLDFMNSSICSVYNMYLLKSFMKEYKL